jgi:hypothetical protein
VRRPASLIATALLVGAHPAAAAPVPPLPTAPLTLGTTTHFGQGWPENRWAMLDRTTTRMVRDGVRWPAIETVPGRYTFTKANAGHLQRLCDNDKRVVLGFGLSHPRYDGGKTVFTPPARAALANYVAAVVERFGACIAAVEIGNEINIKSNITGLAARDRAAAYVAILKSVEARLQRTAPAVKILGGSTNAIATGFLATLADAGMLEHVDGVAVHPYRQDPANVDWELERLQAALDARGPHRPIWATEFSKDFASPAEAPDFLGKMVTLMSAAGVAQAYWYALADQPGFPAMGLFTTTGADKPAGLAYDYWNSQVLARGAAERQGGDATLFHFRFGKDRQVVWGTERSLDFTGSPVFRDSSGKIVAAPARIDDRPLVVEGATVLRFGPAAVVADSLTGYGRPPWSYVGRRGKAAPVALEVIDWVWTSFISHPTLRPAVINQQGLAPAGSAVAPIAMTVRYTAERPGRLFALGCLRRKMAKGDGVTLAIAHNGRTVASYVANPALGAAEALDLDAGDTVDFTVLPNRNAVGDLVAYRYQMAVSAAARPTC